MKQFFSYYAKGMATLTMSFFMLLFAVIKTNAQWIELGGTDSSTFDFYINTITTDAGGNVYAGGRFSDANGNCYVAKWNGMAWSELGGTNASPFKIYIESITADAVGNVYAAGDFADADGNYYVAKWNGTAWSELGGTNGSTFNSFINSIITDASGNVYAAGNFTDANGNCYVAKWNGTAWTELGSTNDSTFNFTIKSIATDAGGNVYAGGFFTDANGNYFVAKWNGTAWSELGGTNSSTFNSDIESIATDASGSVYAGGYFTNANGKYYVAKWNGAAWSQLGGTNGTFNSEIFSISTNVGGNVFAGGAFYNGNGYIYLAEYNQSLPVTLVSLTAAKENKDVTINWQTANEINICYFNVERSTDGSTFTSIGTVKAVGSGANSYEFMDNKPAKGMNYYRLQNVDKDGSFTYSPIRTINEAISFAASIYPNPVQNNLSLNFNSDKAEAVQVEIISNEGKVIATQQIQLAAGASTQSINTASLSNGEYYVRLVTDDEETELKFVKER